MEKTAFENLSVLVFLNEKHLVPIKIQFGEHGIGILAAPGKGEMGEKESIELMEALHKELDKLEVSHTDFCRKMADGTRRTDFVVIPIIKKEK
ncbi:MAG: hypothetical protein V3T98_00390 [Candidatus Paceibacterota bacterium]